MIMENLMSHFFAYLSRMKFIKRWGLMHNTYPENIQEVSPQKFGAENPCPDGFATTKESWHNGLRSTLFPLLEPEALCLKTLTCPALPMNGHTSWSSGC